MAVSSDGQEEQPPPLLQPRAGNGKGRRNGRSSRPEEPREWLKCCCNALLSVPEPAHHSPGLLPPRLAGRRPRAAGPLRGGEPAQGAAGRRGGERSSAAGVRDGQPRGGYEDGGSRVRGHHHEPGPWRVGRALVHGEDRRRR